MVLTCVAKAEKDLYYHVSDLQAPDLAILQASIGHCFSYGRGTPTDSKKALALFRKAAEQGHAAAQLDLGDCYFGGQGTSWDHCIGKGRGQDFDLAAVWYQKAAELGVAGAQFNLARLKERSMIDPRAAKVSLYAAATKSWDQRDLAQWFRQDNCSGLSETLGVDKYRLYCRGFFS
jgi:TPR repeat protein